MTKLKQFYSENKKLFLSRNNFDFKKLIRFLKNFKNDIKKIKT